MKTVAALGIMNRRSKMKSMLLASVATLALIGNAVAAPPPGALISPPTRESPRAMTIYVNMEPGTTTRVNTSRAFKTLVVPNPEVANATAEQFLTDRDMVIQSGPDVTTSITTNIMAYDEDGNLVANVIVKVSPRWPADVWIYRGSNHSGNWASYYCNNSQPCLPGSWPDAVKPTIKSSR